MRSAFKFLLLVTLSFAVLGQDALAQTKKPRNARDSERKLRRSRDSVFKTLNGADTSINSLLQLTEQYIGSFNQINNSLKQGLDTVDISEQLPSVARRLEKIQTLTNTRKSSTLRYLFVLRDNLDHIQDKLKGWQDDLDDVNTKLIQNQHDLIRFTKDSTLKKIPSDSALKSSFLAQRKRVWQLWRKTDSINRADLLKLNLLQNQVAVDYTRILDQSDQIDAKIKHFADVAFDGEMDYPWVASPQFRAFGAALSGTIALNNTQLYYFLKNETTVHLMGGALFILLLVLIYNWRRIFGASEQTDALVAHTRYITTHPIVSALLITTTIAPYFYDHPPVAFLECVFLVSIIFVLVLVKQHFGGQMFKFLFSLFWITVVCCCSNLLVEITNADRFLVLSLSVASIMLAWPFYKKVKQHKEGYLPHTKFILALFILMHIVAVMLNISGRFSLSKIVAITAVFNLWLLMSLYFVVQIIIQGLFLQFHNKNSASNFVSLIDYNIVEKKFISVLGTLSALLWLFFLLQNLNIDDWAHDQVTDLLNQSRTIGGASFTFGGFVIFILVIWLSSQASRLISFFFDVSAQTASDLSAAKKKNRASTLLIRMAVFSAGFLLAVAASGFPLDKLTIIFSAFGVGIGFGLQNVVNNLVSGLILAFEKPIQIGDVIEVDNRSGTIQEIGVRSSKLVTADGAEVIIPNGDLISHHVVNWTLSNSNRRIELLITTAYGTDIEKVKNLLKSLLSSREDIMEQPGASVFVHNVTECHVEFRVFFWASDISNFLTLKSTVLSDIYVTFQKEGIALPSGVKEVNLHFPDGLPGAVASTPKTS